MANNRKEIREYYYKNKDNISDRDLLATMISTTTSNADGREVADKLLEKFHRLSAIYTNTPKSLMKVEGVSEINAIYLSMFREISKRIALGKNKDTRYLRSTEEAVPYLRNMLCEETVERIIIVTLNEKHKIIRAKYISEGSTNFTGVSAVTITKIIAEDDAKYVFFAHNHLGYNSDPSTNDESFTTRVNILLKGFGVKLIDHIIISKKDAHSIIEKKKYSLEED